MTSLLSPAAIRAYARSASINGDADAYLRRMRVRFAEYIGADWLSDRARLGLDKLVAAIDAALETPAASAAEAPDAGKAEADRAHVVVRRFDEGGGFPDAPQRIPTAGEVG